MTVRWYSIVVDCGDIKTESRFWAEALGWPTVYESDGEIVIAPPVALDESRLIPPLERGPGLVFVHVPESKAAKNRLHIDVAPLVGDDQATEVARLERLGARQVDIGQHAQEPSVSWIVMADPEGNEFCVLSPRD